MWRRDYLLSGLITAIMLFCVSGYVFAGPGWSVEGEYFEGCTCNPGCPCLFGSEPTHNKTCKIAGVFHIQVPFHWLIDLFNRHTLGKISWFINIAASHNRYMIGQ